MISITTIWSELTGWLKGMPPKMRILPQSKVTPEMTEWSKKLVYTPSQYPMGTIVQKEFDGKTVIARLEQHTWSHDKSGKIIQGNFRGVTLYEIG